MAPRNAFISSSLVILALMGAGCKDEKAVERKYTASEFVSLAKTAYSALDTYSSKSIVVSITEVSGAPIEITGEALVFYKRPGYLRIEGTIPMTGTTYVVVMNGKGVWSKDGLSRPNWSKHESIEMAIASYTGVSGSAATTIPAILASTMWGYPFALLEGGTVVHDELDGVKTLKLSSKTSAREETLWIDAKTHLLVKRDTVANLDSKAFENLQLPEAQRDLVANIKSMKTHERFVEIKVNQKIDDKLFEVAK